MVSSAALLDGGALQVLSLPQCRPDNSEGRSFPLVLSAASPLTTEETLAFFSVRTDAVEAALRDHGALYLRGLPVRARDSVGVACQLSSLQAAYPITPPAAAGGGRGVRRVHGGFRRAAQAIRRRSCSSPRGAFSVLSHLSDLSEISPTDTVSFPLSRSAFPLSFSVFRLCSPALIVQVHGNVFTSNESPPSETIP